VGQIGDVVGCGENGGEKGGVGWKCGGDDEEVYGFVEGEEVAAGSGIGDGDGTTLGNLLGEELDYAVA